MNIYNVWTDVGDYDALIIIPIDGISDGYDDGLCIVPIDGIFDGDYVWPIIILFIVSSPNVI